MLNLILNAMEAMREVPVSGRLLIVRSRDVENGEIQIEVEDRGSGVDESTADQIFEHLFTTKIGGTGLGLPISRSIIENHGGRIWADAAATRGAIFKFTVPNTRMGEGPSSA